MLEQNARTYAFCVMTSNHQCIGHRFKSGTNQIYMLLQQHRYKKTRGNNSDMMNCTNDTPLHRKHSNIQCNCRQCKRFDYADTTLLPSLARRPRFGGFELIRAIDSETWESHHYYIRTSRRSEPYNKYQR